LRPRIRLQASEKGGKRCGHRQAHRPGADFTVSVCTVLFAPKSTNV
jgi:hypothetical protein